MVDPELFSVTITSTDGQIVRPRVLRRSSSSARQLSIGDPDEQFAIQSCVTPILYSFNLRDKGSAVVHQ